jgi:hypothetical protein
LRDFGNFSSPISAFFAGSVFSRRGHLTGCLSGGYG